MAYIGVQPTDTYLSIASQQITGTGSATYTLDYSVSNEEDVAVFVNNVRQNVSTYTVSGTSLTLGGTISASDSCWILFLGRTVGTKTPAVGSVTGDMLSKPFTYDDASNGSVTGISVNNDYPTTSTASAGTGSGIRFGLNDGSFTSAFGDARGSEILSVTQQSNGRSRDIVFKTDNGGTLGEAMRIDSSSNLKFNSGYGSVVTAYGIRAWVNFNGKNTVSIRDNGNVSSITDNGTGDYTVNFSTAMPDANYSVLIQSGEDTSGSHSNHIGANLHRSAPTTSACRVNTSSLNGSAVDHQFIFVGIIR